MIIMIKKAILRLALQLHQTRFHRSLPLPHQLVIIDLRAYSVEQQADLFLQYFLQLYG